MISNHPEFLAAIADKKLIHITYRDRPDAAPIARDYAPLDYGPDPTGPDLLERYWLWDPAGAAGSNLLGLPSGQIVGMQVLGEGFDPQMFGLGDRAWTVKRSWKTTTESPYSSLDALLSRTVPSRGGGDANGSGSASTASAPAVRRSLMLPATPLPPVARRSGASDRKDSLDVQSAPTPSGFGQLIQQEYALQRALEHNRVATVGSRAADTVRILEYQQTRTSAGIALLDSECAKLPHAARFQPRAWRGSPPANSGGNSAVVSDETGLVALVTLHLELKDSIERLVAHPASSGVASRDLLHIVARDHEEMAWMLTALLNAGQPPSDEAARRHAPAETVTNRADRWENEGGALAPRVATKIKSDER
jgi:hypothetical protein